MSKIEETAKPLGFNVHKRNYKVVYSSCALHLDMLLIVTLVCLLELAKEIKILSLRNYIFHKTMFHSQLFQMKLQGDKTGRKGHLSVATEVFT